MEDKDVITNDQVKIERHKWPDEVQADKKQNRSRKITIITVAFAFFIMGMSFSKTFLGSSRGSTNDKAALIEQIMNSEWYFGKDIEDLETKVQDNGFYGMTSFEVDPHTTYMSAEEMAQYTTNLSGTYVGIGVQYYESESGSFIIQRVFENSPAQKSGLEAGDIMIAVSGVNIEDEDIKEISSMVMGNEGTEVTITVIRDNKEMDFTMKRGKVLHSVFGLELEDNIGYIELDQFGESTAEEVLNYLEKFEGKDSQLIIDLRDNGGGYLNSVVDIASYFIEKDKVVLITEGRNGSQIEQKTNYDKQFNFDEIVILINGGTASASEVLTAALVEHLDNVTVVGTLSYGKGTVQQSRMFNDNSAIKYTTAEWLTPNGNKIHRVGITPDVISELHPIITNGFAAYVEDSKFAYDSVGVSVQVMQEALDFLGFKVDRRDGYFDKSTESALKSFQTSVNLASDGVLTQDVYNSLTSRVIREWTANKNNYDIQLDKAIEILGDK